MNRLLRTAVCVTLLVVSGCYTTVTRAEFRRIVLTHQQPNDVAYIDRDADYDYYRVGSKTYRISHRDPDGDADQYRPHGE